MTGLLLTGGLIRDSYAAESTDSEIQLLSNRLQARCDDKRMELRRELLERVFQPTRNEADFALSMMSLEESEDLNRSLKAIYSPNPEIRGQAVSGARRILGIVLSRTEGQRTLDTEIAQGSPFPSVRVLGKETDWRFKKYSTRISFEANPGDRQYHYSVSMSGPAGPLTQEEAVENALPLECRIFLTGLNKSALYVFPSQVPQFRAAADLADPNRALAALNSAANKRNANAMVSTAGEKPHLMESDPDATAPDPAPRPNSRNARNAK